MTQSEIPPALREQLARFEQLQQNLQTVLVQKQQIDLELAETERAIQELTKASNTDTVYKYAGNLLIKVERDAVLKELQEKKELAATRSAVLAKQEARFRESLRELQQKIDNALKGKQEQSE